VAVQVFDLHDRPLKNIVLSVGGNGSTTPPTDVAGKTQIILPEGTKPGDTVVLILVRAPSPNFILFSPWEGRAVVPNPQAFIAVVIGVRGDAAALRNTSVQASMLTAAVSEAERQGLHKEEHFGRIFVGGYSKCNKA